MPRKTLVLILSLFVLSIVLFAFAIRQNTQPITTPPKPTPSIITPTKRPDEAKLFFTPDPAIVDKNGRVTLTLYLQTTIKQITGVNLSLTYNPKDLNFLSLEQIDILKNTTVIFSDVDKQKGVINYTLGITPQQTPLDGNGNIATLTFTKRAATKAEKTIVTFFENTIISARGQKDLVLKNHEDAIVKLSSTAE